MDGVPKPTESLRMEHVGIGWLVGKFCKDSTVP